MGGMIVKQPNGLYCRFSTIVDCPTNWNMTKEDYIKECMAKAELEAIDILEHHLKPFKRISQCFAPNNMTQEEFEEIFKEMQIEPKEEK